ncbi:MAG TPA: zinc-ribbon domain-containing protein, partial [Thalassobaculum sp.]
MRVTCPECGSKFKVPDKALGSTGRKLRCGKCTHEWFQEPAAPEAPAMPVAASKPGRRQKPEPRPAPPPELAGD